LQEAERDPRLDDVDSAVVRQFVAASRKRENRERRRRTFVLSSAFVLVVTIAALIIGIQKLKSDIQKQRDDQILQAQQIETENQKALNEQSEAARNETDIKLSLSSAQFGLEQAGLQDLEQDPTGALVWYSKAIELWRTGMADRQCRVAWRAARDVV
jgi:hypothetical protein